MKAKKLYFEPSHAAFPGLTPIRTHIPDWYKDMKKFNGGKPQFRPNKTVGIKECAPFLDAMSIGYSLPLVSDLLVELEDGKTKCSWHTADDQDLLDVRAGLPDEKFPHPPGFYNSRLAWRTRVAIEIPSGYSMLVTHPLNRVDLPFYTLSGVIDSFTMSTGSLPFFLREGFEGLIPAGTPIAQLIPFKRDNWDSELKPGVYAKSEINRRISVSTLVGWYKQNIWQKKSYN